MVALTTPKMASLMLGISIFFFLIVSCVHEKDNKAKVVFRNNISGEEIKVWVDIIEDGLKMSFFNSENQNYELLLSKKQEGLFEGEKQLFPFDSTNHAISDKYFPPFLYPNCEYIRKKKYIIRSNFYDVYIFSQYKNVDNGCESYFVDGFGFIGFRGFENNSYYYLDREKSSLPLDIIELEQKIFKDSLFIYKVPAEKINRF